MPSSVNGRHRRLRTLVGISDLASQTALSSVLYLGWSEERVAPAAQRHRPFPLRKRSGSGPEVVPRTAPTDQAVMAEGQLLHIPTVAWRGERGLSGASASGGKSVAAMSHRTGFVENLAAAGTKCRWNALSGWALPKVGDQWPRVSLHAAR